MKRLLIGLVTAASLTGAVIAQEAVPPVPAIEDTIQSQIDAFLADDFATAFTFASPTIRNIFRTPENFGAMVRNGYPMVWRPKAVQYGPLREIEGALWQEVIVTDATGRVHALGYRMEQIDGNWRISGVQLLKAPDLSA
jgi:opacity protein-like surface antigen